MLAGEVGDFSSVSTGADQVLPPSADSRPYCAPIAVRHQLNNRPPSSSTTPGSCKPAPVAFGAAHQVPASRQLAPSSSERYHMAMPRESKEPALFGSPVRERWNATGTMRRPALVWI